MTNKIEAAAREAAREHRKETERHYYTDNERCTKQISFELGYLAGHASRDEEVGALQARVAEVTAQRDAFMDSREEVVALRARLVQQAIDYRNQVVFWGENADERSAEIAALRQKLAEAEGRAAKWVGEEEHTRMLALGWTCGPEAVWHRGPGMVEAAWHYLMVPPAPLPETKP